MKANHGHYCYFLSKPSIEGIHTGGHTASIRIPNFGKSCQSFGNFSKLTEFKPVFQKSLYFSNHKNPARTLLGYNALKHTYKLFGFRVDIFRSKSIEYVNGALYRDPRVFVCFVHAAFGRAPKQGPPLPTAPWRLFSESKPDRPFGVGRFVLKRVELFE